MKFLVDVCAGEKLREWLLAGGHDVAFVGDRDPRMEDEVVLSWAYEETRILVTIDKDFGQFIFEHGKFHHGIIRLPNVPSEKRKILVKEVLERHSSDLEVGAIITVKPGRIRVRHR